MVGILISQREREKKQTFRFLFFVRSLDMKKPKNGFWQTTATYGHSNGKREQDKEAHITHANEQ